MKASIIGCSQKAVRLVGTRLSSCRFPDALGWRRTWGQKRRRWWRPVIDRLEGRPPGTGRPPLPTLKVVEARCGASCARACNGASCGPLPAGRAAPPCAVAWTNGPARPVAPRASRPDPHGPRRTRARPLGRGGRQLFGAGQARRRADRRQPHRPRQSPGPRCHVVVATERLAAGCRPARPLSVHDTAPSFGICRAWLLANKRLDRRQRSRLGHIISALLAAVCIFITADRSHAS